MTKTPFTSEDLFRLKMVGHPSLSPDGQQLLFTVTEVLDKENGYCSSIWRVSQEGGAQPFTNKGGQGKVRDQQPTWSPDGQQVAFLSNRNGKTQIWLISAHGGEAFPLTDMPKGVNGFVWAPDGSRIIFAAKEDLPQTRFREGATARRITKLRYKFNGVGYYDELWVQLWSVELATKQVTRLTTGACHSNRPAVSPDGRLLAFTSNRSGDQLVTMDDLWVMDMASGAMSNLTKGVGPVHSFTWSPDGQHIVFTGHAKGIYPGGYPELWEVEVKSGERRLISREFQEYLGNSVGSDMRFDGGSTGPVVSDCGKQVYVTSTVGGNCYLYGIDRDTGAATHLFGEGQAVVNSFSVANGCVALNLATPFTLGDLWVGGLGGALKQVTRLNEALLAQREMSWPEPMEMVHSDGTKLEGWVMKPIGFTPGQHYPLVMEIHGGPHTTFGNHFFHEFQILAGLGFGVFYTNPRGSLGYGEDFARACVGDWCGVDADDLLFMAQEAAKIAWVDTARIGVTGGSQGGYFTNWLIGHTDMFAAAVTQRSMSNLYSKYGVSDIGWSGDRYGMGGADLWEHEDFIMERSPMRYARNVKTPCLILHSDEDYRCPLEQAEQWYVALKRLGVTTEMVLFHGENHELSRSGRPANRIVRLEALTDWFKQFLLQK
ncbi:MAG: S9 family peptidase [Bacillota bacterium]